MNLLIDHLNPGNLPRIVPCNLHVPEVGTINPGHSQYLVVMLRGQKPYEIWRSELRTLANPQNRVIRRDDRQPYCWLSIKMPDSISDHVDRHLHVITTFPGVVHCIVVINVRRNDIPLEALQVAVDC